MCDLFIFCPFAESCKGGDKIPIEIIVAGCAGSPSIEADASLNEVHWDVVCRTAALLIKTDMSPHRSDVSIHGMVKTSYSKLK